MDLIGHLRADLLRVDQLAGHSFLSFQGIPGPLLGPLKRRLLARSACREMCATGKIDGVAQPNSPARRQSPSESAFPLVLLRGGSNRASSSATTKKQGPRSPAG